MSLHLFFSKVRLFFLKKKKTQTILIATLSEPQKNTYRSTVKKNWNISASLNLHGLLYLYPELEGAHWTSLFTSKATIAHHRKKLFTVPPQRELLGLLTYGTAVELAGFSTIGGKNG